MRRKLLIALAVLAALAAIGFGHWLIGELRHAARLADQKLRAGERAQFAKAALPCPRDALVFVALGQSNAANHAAAPLAGPPGTVDFYDGACREGGDPLLGATGTGGSIWMPFAAAFAPRNVVFASVAVGASPIADWQPGGAHLAVLEETLAAMKGRGLRPDAFLFFQGEADRETDEESYAAGLTALADTLERMAPGVPLVVSGSSVCGEGTGPVAALSAAREAVIAARSGVHAGPVTDDFGDAYRYAACHFNETGQRALGAAWADAVGPILEGGG